MYFCNKSFLLPKDTYNILALTTLGLWVPCMHVNATACLVMVVAVAAAARASGQRRVMQRLGLLFDDELSIGSDYIQKLLSGYVYLLSGRQPVMH